MKEQALDILKKFWFVILVGVIFISFAIYFAWDTNKDKIPGKSVDGKDVIFSTDDYNYTADSYYKSLYETENNGTKAGVAQLYTLLQKQIASTIDADSTMEEAAKTQAENMLAQWESSASSYIPYYDNQLKAMGYSGGTEDLEEYTLDIAKLQKLTKDYIKKHPELFDEVYESDSPREISHILIAFDDAANPTETPTEAEQKKMDKVMKALDKGQKFASVAKKYSEDGSASEGGRLGVQIASNLVSQFSDVAWSLKAGEMSGWVKSEYGYHLILVNNTDKEKMLKKEANLDSITTLIQNKNTNLTNEIIWNTAKKLKIEFKDKALKKELMEYIGVKDKD
ncbi:MAG: foldase [Erysipelotrichia bacterium]|nr:foldase [Erysipelotrichia bacterium]